MNISLSDALPLFTNEIVSKYTDHRKPKAFGRSFFKEVETATKLASMLSQRGMNLMATDIARGTRGNLNVFDRSTQNIVLPPYFNEMFNMVELDSYDALYVDGTMSKINFGKFLDDVASKMDWCMDTIDRRYEYQCWQLLLTGIVTLNNGQNLNSGRKAASLFDPGAPGYWETSNVDPDVILEQGAAFLNEVGKMAGDTVNVIFGANAWTKFKNNPKVIARATQVQWGQEQIVPQIRNSVGGSFNGTSSIGSFNYRFWTYADFVETQDPVTGIITQTPFMDTDSIVMLPEAPTNVLTYTAVPQLLTSGQKPAKGKFQVWDAVSEFKDAHYMGVKSAGFPALGGIDLVFTAKVTA